MLWYLTSYFKRTYRALLAFMVLLSIVHMVLWLSGPLQDAWADIAYMDLLLALCALAFWVYGLFSFSSRTRLLHTAYKQGLPLTPAILEGARDEDIRFVQQLLLCQSQRAEAELTKLQAELSEQREALARWAHEVKTPLSVLELILERQESASIRPAMQAQLARIQQQVSQVLHIERLLDLNQSLDMRQLEFAPLARGALARIAPLLMARELAVELETMDVTAMGDVQCVAYVLDQLLSNAAKYAPQGDELRIGAGVSNGLAMLWVANHGAPIPTSDMRRLFDKGFSGKQRTNAKSSGMGLYYARKTALAMGGDLQAASGPEETRFTLTLPMFQAYLSPAAK